MTLAQRYAYGMLPFISPLREPAGFILAYTWTGAPRSDGWQGTPQPILGQIVREHALRPGEPGGKGWVEETVPLATDFRRAFGVPPTQLIQVAVFADAGGTHEQTDAAVEGLRLWRCSLC